MGTTIEAQLRGQLARKEQERASSAATAQRWRNRYHEADKARARLAGNCDRIRAQLRDAEAQIDQLLSGPGGSDTLDGTISQIQVLAAKLQALMVARDDVLRSELGEMHCAACDYDEAEGGLVAHCNRCCRTITKWAWERFMLRAPPVVDAEAALDRDLLERAEIALKLLDDAMDDGTVTGACLYDPQAVNQAHRVLSGGAIPRDTTSDQPEDHRNED